MPKYVIEREMPDAGSLSTDQVTAISHKSRSMMKNLAPQILWIESFVAQDKIYCIYLAPNEKIVREHAKEGDFRQTGYRK
jgi:Nickel responsive protein SCO4226-like